MNITNKDVEALVQTIASEMQADKWIPDYIVGLTRGGLIPAVMLSQYLNIPMQALNVSLSINHMVSDLGMAEDAQHMKNRKNILIIDDINDTGATLNWIKDDWQSSCPTNSVETIWGNNVRTAVLVNNTGSVFQIDYYGSTIDKSANPEWVNFPWETWWKYTKE